MKINYLKVIPVFIVQFIKLAPIIYKWGKFLYDDIKRMYDKDELEKLDETIKEALTVKEE